MKRNEVTEIIERKYARYTTAVVEQIKGLPESARLSGDDSPLRSVWEEWKDQVQEEESYFFEIYVETIETLCRCLTEDLPVDEQALLWLTTDDYFDLDEGDPLPYGDTMVEAVAAEIYRRVYRFAEVEPLQHTRDQTSLEW